MKSAYFDLKIEKNIISLLLSLMSDMLTLIISLKIHQQKVKIKCAPNIFFRLDV